MPKRLAHTVLADLSGLPRQFWLLTAGTLFYVVGLYMAFPFATLFMTERLDISLTTVGLLFGVIAVVGLPFQFPAGTCADRVGRKPVLALAAVGSMLFCFLLAISQTAWLAAIAIFSDSAFGWPMYLTASHTLIADLAPPARRAEAMSIVRTAINVGMAVGPLLAAPLLAASGSYRLTFFVGGGVAGVFLVMIVVGIRETLQRSRCAPRPAEAADMPLAVQPPEPGLESVDQAVIEAAPDDAQWSGAGRRSQDTRASASDARTGPEGYGVVLHDRRFLAFCAAMVLPLYGFGQLWVILPVVMREVHGVQPADWGYLMTVFAATAAVLQYPLVRGVRTRDPLFVLAAAALVLCLSISGMVFAPYGWPSYLLMAALGIGFLLVLPLGTSVVSGMAPLDLRGRYLGVWTFFFLGGYSLGPLLGGVVVDTLGARGAFLVVAVAGIVGAALLVGLGAALRRRAPGSHDAEGVT